MTTFRAWRSRLSLTQREAAARLGYGKRWIEAFDRGEAMPPLVVRLAMAAIEARLAAAI
jgi:transcriptional regulator with XRE-family HTH domain